MLFMDVLDFSASVSLYFVLLTFVEFELESGSGTAENCGKKAKLRKSSIRV